MSPRAARALTAAAALALAAAAVLPLLLLGGARDPATVGADGPESMRGLLAEAGSGGREATVVTSTPLILRGDPAVKPADTLLIVLGADRAPTAQEADALRGFLEAGGRAIVAEEDGLAGALTAPFGVAFERAAVVHANGDTPIQFAGAEGGEGAAAVHARLPTPLILPPGSTAEVAATTADDAFVDRDQDGQFSRADPSGPFVAAARVPVGDNGGELLVLGSLDLLSDRLAEDPAVAAWRAGLLASMAPEGTLVVLDESHRAHTGGAAAAAWVVRSTSESPFRWIAAGAAVVAAFALVAFSQALPAWGPHVHKPDRFRSRREARSGLHRGAARDPQADGPARRAWTRRAHVAFAGAVLLLAGGAVLRSAPAVCAGAALCAPLLVAGLRLRPSVTVTRQVAEGRVSEGQEVPVEVTLRARRGADLEVRDGVPPEDAIAGPAPWRRMLLPRGAQATLAYTIVPSLRGPHLAGPVRVRSSDPLRLSVDDVPADGGAEVQVLPKRHTLKRVKLPVRRPDLLMGAHPVNRAGEGTEFQALREYQAGDALRTVNWKASARSKTLMVNQRVLESQTILTLVLDARAVSDCGPASSTPLASSARAILTIAGAAAQGRDKLRVVLYGADVADLPPAPPQRFLHELAGQLASLPAAGDLSFATVAAKMVPNLRPGTPVALFSGLEGDAGFAEGARQIVARGASLTVFAAPIATSGDGEEDPGAAAIHAQREANVKALRGTGALVHELRNDMPLEVLLRLQGVGR